MMVEKNLLETRHAYFVINCARVMYLTMMENVYKLNNRDLSSDKFANI